MAKSPPPNSQPFDSLGQTWWLSEVGPGIRKAFAVRVRLRARRQLEEEKPFTEPEKWQEEWDRLQARIDQGAYEWNPPVELGGAGAGKAIRAAFEGDQTSMELIQLLLQATHDDLSPEQVGKIYEGNPEGIQAALRAAMGLPPLAQAPAAQPGTETTTKTN